MATSAADGRDDGFTPQLVQAEGDGGVPLSHLAETFDRIVIEISHTATSPLVAAFRMPLTASIRELVAPS